MNPPREKTLYDFKAELALSRKKYVTKAMEFRRRLLEAKEQAKRAQKKRQLW
jgi:hypothetical protein